MKQFKRLFAAILLGAMLLTVFTGCTRSPNKEKNVFNVLKTALGDKYEITEDAELQKKAETFAKVFVKGENLESNRNVGRAYAKVSESEKEFWEIMDADKPCVMPAQHITKNDKVNAALFLPYTDNAAAIIPMLTNLGVLSEIQENEYHKVGIAIANVKGDDYVVIVADK